VHATIYFATKITALGKQAIDFLVKGNQNKGEEVRWFFGLAFLFMLF